MDKRIGKIVVLLIGLVSGIVEASKPSLTLRVTDEEGNPLQNAGISVPFIIQVEVVSDNRQNLGKPRLALSQGLEVTEYGTSNSMRTMNGVTSMRWTHQYHARADVEGQITVGPATLDLGSGGSATSNAVTLQVSTQQKSSGSSKQSSALVVLSASPEHPYVGQPVTFSLRFYALDERIQLDQIQEPDFKGCKSTKLMGPFSGTEQRAGQQYSYLEWTATIHPEQEGRLIIPAVFATIVVPAQRSTGRMDLFSMMSGMLGGGRTERVYSNPLVLNVRPLPEYDGQTSGAIGKFTSFHAKATPIKAETGEGITLTLELVGKGNMVMIGHPKLTVPEGIKYYDANAKEQALSDIVSKKDFEYIMQALQPGNYTIPEQAFTYFDPELGQYKTITSRSVKIAIIGEAKKATSVEEAPVVRETVHQKTDLPALEKVVVGSARLHKKRIPLTLFLVLLFLLTLPLFAAGARFFWRRYQQAYAPERIYKKAFYTARKKLKTAKHARKGSDVYHIFKQLFKERLRLEDHEFSENVVEEALKKAKLPVEKLHKWRQYFSHTMAVAFSALPADLEIYEEGEQWILLLERLL